MSSMVNSGTARCLSSAPMNGVGSAEDEAGDCDLGAACASLVLRELGLVGQVAVVVLHEYRHGIFH
jgi:hypothetical protein